jgi:hypothetical protein
LSFYSEQFQRALVETLENIDNEQSVLVSRLSEEGQELLFQQLDVVQETYLNLTERFTDYVTEMASKCFSEMVIYQIVLEELLMQIRMCKQQVDQSLDTDVSALYTFVRL